MLAIVQAIAGFGYLLQKILLFFAEGDKTLHGKRLRILGWSSYLIGLPMWMVVFFIEKNWILAFVEGGGLPSMLLGLLLAVKEKPKKHTWERQEEIKADGGLGYLDWFAFSMTIIGIVFSIYYFGGFERLSQWLETSVSVGFLAGTYMLAKKNPKGWLWYILMNGSAGSLMYYQGYAFLTFQQGISLGFVLMAYRKARKAVKSY